MQSSGPAQPGPLAPDEEVSSQHIIKRRRTSELSSAFSLIDQHESITTMPAAQRTANMRDSSRESSSPPDDAKSVRYTRTGRVSRANKGQRVHHCEECGNVSDSSFPSTKDVDVVCLFQFSEEFISCAFATLPSLPTSMISRQS